MNPRINLLLRVGVAFAFLYPPIAALITPLAWVGFFPEFIRAMPVDEMVLLHLFGIFEVAIGLWILSGKRIFIPSILAAASLFFIVIFNLAQLDVLFRDIPILLMAIALAFDTYQTRHPNNPRTGLI